MFGQFIARQSSFSSPLLSLCLTLGLGAYSSSTDDDSDADEGGKVEDHSDWEPEHVLKVRLARASNINSQFPLTFLGEDQTKVVEFRAEGERDSRTIGQNC